MESTLLFVFGCILCLMFLGMLYGERLSMIGVLDGEWLSPIGGLMSRVWGGLCESIDRTLEFVLSHLSWVVAAASGVTGLTTIAFLMGGGIASDAIAYHQDISRPLHAGGVIDQIQKVPATTRLPAVLLAKETDISEFVSQERTADYVLFGRPENYFPRPRPRRPIEGGTLDDIVLRPQDPPDLAVSFRRLSSSMLLMEDSPDVVTRGRLIDSLPDPRFVDRILSRLAGDRWQESLEHHGVEPGLPQDGMPESPLTAVRDLEAGQSQVRITPGLLVSEHDLRVTKEFPREAETGEVTVVVNLRNMGRQTIDGLLVREILPLRTVVRGAEPLGVLRDDTLTWLVDDLRPAEEFQLRFTVLPADLDGAGRDSLFESATEISALTAVTAETAVEGDSVPDPFPAERRRARDLAGVPELQLSIDTPEEPVRVGERTNVYFSLSNVGDAPARNIRLRLTLDETLDHEQLLSIPIRERTASDRQVFVPVNLIEAGETQRFRLEVQPTASGMSLSVADVLLDGESIGRKSFRLAAQNPGRSR